MARLILILLVSVYGISMQGQLTLSASKLIQDPGDEFFVDITAVEGFDSIAALQFAMHWDSSVIEFQDIDNFALPTNNIQTHFSYSYLANGLLPFVWIHPSAESTTFPDNTSILRFKFKAIGPASSSTPFEIVGTQTADVKALGGYDYHSVDLTIVDGEVKLTPVMSVGEIAELEEATIRPNPSSEDIRVDVSLNQPIDLTWIVYDFLGKPIKQGLLKKANGHQIIKIEREIFPEAGIYLFSVKSAQGVFTRKLIVQQ